MAGHLPVIVHPQEKSFVADLSEAAIAEAFGIPVQVLGNSCGNRVVSELRRDLPFAYVVEKWLRWSDEVLRLAEREEAEILGPEAEATAALAYHRGEPVPEWAREQLAAQAARLVGRALGR